ncbi:MAG: hypothetical protein ACI9VR_000327 [Cognaticolwellia sp.]|jgi:hypothetical protein
MKWIRPLPANPLDIVGDVHGEYQALEELLSALGWMDGSAQAAGRRLVFVGDLVDRGPDSIKVVDRVADLVQQGLAQVTLGNHELNLLRQELKSGNNWFFGQEELTREGQPFQSRLASSVERSRLLDFFKTLPLALERSDVRVAHACWDPSSVDRLRNPPDGDICQVVNHWDRQTEQQILAAGLSAQAKLESAPYDLRDPTYTPPLLRNAGKEELMRQSGNPARVLTSGTEMLANHPFFAAGRWRMLRRVPWWEYYKGPLVVMGHYWRRTPAMGPPPPSQERGIFKHEHPFDPMGAGHAFCVDYSVGRRYAERLHGLTPFQAQLGALRLPAEGDKGPVSLQLGTRHHKVELHC